MERTPREIQIPRIGGKLVRGFFILLWAEPPILASIRHGKYRGIVERRTRVECAARADQLLHGGDNHRADFDEEHAAGF